MDGEQRHRSGSLESVESNASGVSERSESSTGSKSSSERKEQEEVVVGRMMSVGLATPKEEVQRLLQAERWEEALELAGTWDLEMDVVHIERWRVVTRRVVASEELMLLDSLVGDVLDRMSDRSWVLEMCRCYVCKTLEGARLLIRYALVEEERKRGDEGGGEGGGRGRGRGVNKMFAKRHMRHLKAYETILSGRRRMNPALPSELDLQALLSFDSRSGSNSSGSSGSSSSSDSSGSSGSRGVIDIHNSF